MAGKEEDLAGLSTQENSTVENPSQDRYNLDDVRPGTAAGLNLFSLQTQLSNDSQPSSPGLEQLLKHPTLTSQNTEKIISSLAAISPGISNRLGWSFLSSLSPKSSGDQEVNLTEMSTPATGTPLTPTPLSSLFKGFSTPTMSSTSSIPESAGITPLRGISLESVVSGLESTAATPSGGVSLDTPGSKSGGKDVRVSLRGTKRTKSDDTVTKTGSEARQAKRSKSESSSAQKKSTTSKVDKRPVRNFGSVQMCVKDIGRWRATDDILLINAVEQTNDLNAVHAGVKFSCKFTLKEIESRWQALLYDKHISNLSVQAIQSVQPGVLASETQEVPWSEEEETLLSTIPSSNLGELKTFQTLLEDNVSTFHFTRSPRALQYHWALMRHFCLLCDQEVGHIPADVNLTSFNEWEEEIDDSELMKPRTAAEEALDQELVIADRKAKREIAFLEKDIQKWERVLGIEEYSFPAGVLAVFKGQSTTYEMKTKEITIGRGSLGGEKVDIDLMHEMANNKVSRRQAVVKLDKSGDLVLRNIGRRPLYVHGRPILPGQSTKLENRQIIEICNIVLTVYVKGNSSTQDRERDPNLP